MSIFAGAAGAVLGGIAGAQGQRSSTDYTSGIRVAPETALEQYASGDLLSRLKELGGIVSAGPGIGEQQAALTAQQGLASTLDRYAQGGFLPSEADTQQAFGLANQLFSPQMRQMQEQAQRRAALLGRSGADPVLQARLAQQQSDLVNPFVAQQAMSLPLQRLQFQQQAADLRAGLASQALANRSTLMSMGSQLREADRSYRINTGERYGNQSTTSGGGVAGAISGALAGFGAGMSAYNTFAGAGGGGNLGGSAGLQMPSLGAQFGSQPSSVFGFNFNSPSATPGATGGSVAAGRGFMAPTTPSFASPGSRAAPLGAPGNTFGNFNF